MTDILLHLHHQWQCKGFQAWTTSQTSIKWKVVAAPFHIILDELLHELGIGYATPPSSFLSSESSLAHFLIARSWCWKAISCTVLFFPSFFQETGPFLTIEAIIFQIFLKENKMIYHFGKIRLLSCFYPIPLLPKTWLFWAYWCLRSFLNINIKYSNSSILLVA